MKKALLLSASALVMMIPAAFAADVIAPEPVATWTGFHIGVGGGAGYNFYDAESEFAVEAFDDGGPEAILSIDGNDLGAWYGFGTVEAGFDYQFADSPFVVGILANYDFNGDSSAEASSHFFEDDDGNFADSSIEAELEDSWFLGGRLGFAVNNDTLFYGLGGYTWIKGKVNARHETTIPYPDGTEFDEKESVDGWTAGAGIEHMVTENLSLKVEYRHDFLDDIQWNGFANDPDDDDGGIDEDNTHSGKVDFSRDTVRAVLSWRFNPGW
jgi:outer membrane immunogenic protein